MIRSLIIALLGLLLCIVPSNISQAVGVPFRGEADDHFWDITVVFCRDAIRVTGDEVMHTTGPFPMGDELRFSLVLSRTSNLITQQLPIKMATSDGVQPRELLHTTVAYRYATLQNIGTAQSVTIERWEHGVDSTDETGSGDMSDFDDVEVLNGNVVNCTAASQPHFDTPPSPPSGQQTTIKPGNLFSLALQASDDDAYDTSVTFQASGLPPGATITPNTTGNPASMTLNWTPTTGQNGIHVITITAQDPTGRISTPYTATISVSATGTSIFLPLVKH